MPASELRAVIEGIGRDLGLAEIYVFGSRCAEIASRVRGEPASAAEPPLPGSDVDIGVRPLPGRRLDARTLVEIAGRLEDALEVGRVDVVNLPPAPPFLALEVIRGEILYCADPDDQAEFELYVLRRAGDLAPFQRARHRMALDRWKTP